MWFPWQNNCALSSPKKHQIHCHCKSNFKISTRMHSSRKRTGRSLTVSWRVCPNFLGFKPLLDADPPLDTDPSPVNRMTQRCKNITFPQTSFAGGNNIKVQTINNNYFQIFSFSHVKFLKSGFAFMKFKNNKNSAELNLRLSYSYSSKNQLRMPEKNYSNS